jgi:coenzyme F420-reducing hydrogenase alpha subunit
VPSALFIPGEPRAAVGMGCTEAPRGLLYHRYKLDQDGSILEAKIVPPTAQNQKIIESDLKHYAAKHLDLSDEALTWQCEQTVRNYDPCISCATHYLRVKIERD